MEGASANPQQQAQHQQQAAAAAEEQAQQKSFILSQILTPAAKERLARIGLVKKDKARVLEDTLIRMAQAGRLQGKLDEKQLISMLESASANDSGPKVTISRKKYNFDSESESDDDSW